MSHTDLGMSYALRFFAFIIGSIALITGKARSQAFSEGLVTKT